MLCSAIDARVMKYEVIKREVKAKVTNKHQQKGKQIKVIAVWFMKITTTIRVGCCLRLESLISGLIIISCQTTVYSKQAVLIPSEPTDSEKDPVYKPDRRRNQRRKEAEQNPILKVDW